MNSKLSTYTPSPEREQVPGIFKTSINGLYFIAHKKHTDDRGFFAEILRINELEGAAHIDFRIKQVNHARSEKNVVRGIHAEDWNKLVFVSAGLAFCAICDVRPDSATFGKKEYFFMGVHQEALDGSLYVPAGLGNSVCILEGPVDYIYCVDRLYKERDPAGDVAISLFDPDLAVEWPLFKEDMIISERDKNSITLREKYPEKFK
ncbi:N/A [soil metagenome]